MLYIDFVETCIPMLVGPEYGRMVFSNFKNADY